MISVSRFFLLDSVGKPRVQVKYVCIFVFKMFLGILGLLSQTIVNTFIISAFQRGKNVKKEKKFHSPHF